MNRRRKVLAGLYGLVGALAAGNLLLLVLHRHASVSAVMGTVLSLVVLCSVVLLLFDVWRRVRRTGEDQLRVDVTLESVIRRLEVLDERGRQRTDRLDSVIQDTRTKASRHEYHAERTLRRIENMVAASRHSVYMNESVTRQPLSPTVLMVTSNGAGLGHVTRLMAVGRELPGSVRVEMVTLSSGYRSLGPSSTVPIHYFPSAEKSDSDLSVWNAEFTRYLHQKVRALRPSIILFDGTWLYPSVTHVARAAGSHLIWMQRGCWRPEVDAASVQRHAAAEVCDEVLVPGDYGCVETVDAGPHVTVTHLEPVTLLRPSDLRTREDACRELGLDPRQKHVLISLGGGILSDGHGRVQELVEYVCELGSQWVPVVLSSPLTSGSNEQRFRTLAKYPVSPYLRAFEAVVSAAGYNSVQEIVATRTPAVLIPNRRTITDDQVARARNLSSFDFIRVCEDAADVREALNEVVKVNVDRSALQGGCAGASQAAARVMAKLSTSE